MSLGSTPPPPPDTKMPPLALHQLLRTETSGGCFFSCIELVHAFKLADHGSAVKKFLRLLYAASVAT